MVDSTEINAFALPGGFVYITRGLLAYLNSEAELAGAGLGQLVGLLGTPCYAVIGVNISSKPTALVPIIWLRVVTTRRRCVG